MGYEVEIGQVLDRRFQITGVLSQGGMAIIFRAVDRLTPPRPYGPLTRLGIKWLAFATIPLVAFGLLYVLGHRP